MRGPRLLVPFIVVLAITAAGFADLSDGLVTYYSFSGNAEDDSGNGHDGTVYGAMLTVDRFGVKDSAYTFDGVDDYIIAPYSDALNSSAFTIAAWVLPSNDLALGAGAGVVAARGEDSYSDRLWGSLQIYGQDSTWGNGITLLYEDSSDKEQVLTTGVYPQTDVWSHIACTRTSSGEVALYLNGILIGHWLDTMDPASTCTQDLSIGARWSSSTTQGPYNRIQFFPGAIDEVCIYDRSLSATEIAELTVVPLPTSALLSILGISIAGYRLKRQIHQRPY